MNIKLFGHSERRTKLFVFSLVLIHTALLARGAFVHSPTTDEGPMLVAGISHWELGRFELYRVTAPLVRLVAAIPAIIMGAETSWDRFHDAPGSRAEYAVGFDFYDINGPRALWFITLGRWALIPFSLLGLIVCFLWARDLFGSNAGVLAATLWCFSPSILANAQLIMTDAAGAALFLTANYCYWYWLQEPSWSRAFCGGILFGLLQLTKGTFVILFGLWPVLWLVYRGFGSPHRIKFLREAGQLGLTFVLGLYVLNSGYGFEGSFQKLGDYYFLSHALAGKDPGEQHNRFADTWMAEIPVPLPENYVRGIDHQKSYFDRKLRSYLRGEWRLGGWWYYYLYAMLIKIPLGTWLLLIVAAIVFLIRRTAYRPSEDSSSEKMRGWRDEMVLAVPLLAILCLVSSQTGFSKNFRYVLPCLPFMFVWVSRITPVLVCPTSMTRYTLVPLRGLAMTGLCWTVGSSIWFYPHSLSYFNELAGGPRHGHHHLIHTNIDFGQDLFFLKQWVAENCSDRPLYLAYYGMVDPKLVGINHELPPRQIPPNVEPNLSDVLPPGVYAVSVNLMRGHEWSVFDSQGKRVVAAPNDYSYFLDYEPNALAGYSIYIFDVQENRGNNTP